MAAEEDQDDKQFDPSQRRLDQAREQGDTIRSEELQAAAAAAGLLAALAVGGGWAVQQAGSAGMAFLDAPDRLSLGQGAQIGGLLARMAVPAGVLLVAPGVAVLAWLIASRGIAFAPSRLAFKPDRLSILSNAKQKFGRAGLMDFARRVLKLIAVSLVLAIYLQSSAEALFYSLRMDAGQIGLMIAGRVTGFLLLVLALTTVFGGADFLLQRHNFLQRHRMTRKEMTDEMKDSEGDPHLKADRRRRAQEIATRQMLVDVPKADVVIVNPTHYAVALKWDRARGRAPVCVAKGVDEIAARIRECAQGAGVPVRSDPPTARALHAALDVGQEIRREHYAAVAAAIRFADALRKRAKKVMP